MVLRSLVLAAAVALVTAGSAWAACAEYITSGWGETPSSGYLTGEEQVTVTLKIGGLSVSRTYDIGYYRMSDGSTQKLDCRDYSPTLLV